MEKHLTPKKAYIMGDDKVDVNSLFLKILLLLEEKTEIEINNKFVIQFAECKLEPNSFQSPIFVFCFSFNKIGSFQEIIDFYNNYQKTISRHLVIIVGLDSDKKTSIMNTERGKYLAELTKARAYIECSIKNNINVKQIIEMIFHFTINPTAEPAFFTDFNDSDYLSDHTFHEFCAIFGPPLRNSVPNCLESDIISTLIKMFKATPPMAKMTIGQTVNILPQQRVSNLKIKKSKKTDYYSDSDE